MASSCAVFSCRPFRLATALATSASDLCILPATNSFSWASSASACTTGQPRRFSQVPEIICRPFLQAEETSLHCSTCTKYCTDMISKKLLASNQGHYRTSGSYVVRLCMNSKCDNFWHAPVTAAERVRPSLLQLPAPALGCIAAAPACRAASAELPPPTSRQPRPPPPPARNLAAAVATPTPESPLSNLLSLERSIAGRRQFQPYQHSAAQFLYP